MSVKVIIFYCWYIVVWGVQATFYKENITDFTKCDTHISRSERQYTQFYEINKDIRPINDSLVFDFHFGVLARSDAHILLAESDVLQRTDPVYEIVIGAGGNTFTDLRRLQKSDSKVTTRMKGLLSEIEVRSFWIHVRNEGVVEVGKETEELAFIAWEDPQPLNLKYFSFSTWPGVEAKWYFNCQRSITKGSELILTSMERLQHDLLKDYNVFIRPVLDESHFTSVDFSLAPQYISLDVVSSKLRIKGTGYMKWTDEKLKWDPQEYGDIKLLKLPSHQLWTPDLRLDDSQVNLRQAVLYQNGSVFCDIHLDLTCWCNIEDLASWPNDVHNCTVTFHFMRDEGMLNLTFSGEKERFFNLPSSTEWVVIDLDVKYNDFVDNDYYSVENTEENPPNLTFLLILKRTSTAYRLIFLTPFLVITICALCTFWTSPYGYIKITLCCVQLIMESIILICISNIIPGHSTTVPVLVRLYSDALVSTVVLVIVSIIVINLSRNEYKKYSMPEFIHHLLSSNNLQRLLFLPSTKNDSVYGRLSENHTRLKESAETSPWVLLGITIDRIFFIVYSILYVALISRTC